MTGDHDGRSRAEDRGDGGDHAGTPIGVAAAVVLSLALRVWHRGPYAAGWDFIGPAQGLWLCSTRSAADILRWDLEHLFPSWPWNVNGISLVPGCLAAVWPWLWWPHVWAALVATVCFVLLWRATEGPFDALALGLAASGTLLSWSVAGLLFMSALLPHALVLWTIARWRRRPVTTALLAVLACALSWQGQELGQLATLALIAAAVLIAAPWRTRFVWGVVGAAVEFRSRDFRPPTKAEDELDQSCPPLRRDYGGDGRSHQPPDPSGHVGVVTLTRRAETAGSPIFSLIPLDG